MGREIIKENKDYGMEHGRVVGREKGGVWQRAGNGIRKKNWQRTGTGNGMGILN